MIFIMQKNQRAPRFPHLQYCIRCCMPETQEGIKFDEIGMCQACQSSEQKIHINWIEKEKQLRKIFEKAKKQAGDNYDCILPISGGKDSTFQMHVLVKVYGMRPLAVTFNHNWYSKTGWYNLINSLETFNIDHIMYTPNRGLVNRLAKRSVETIGDTCWHCHAGTGAFPLQIAVKFHIPLLVWGESIAESSGRASYYCPVRKFDRDYFTKVSAKLKPEDIVSENISKRDLKMFNTPTERECKRSGVFGIHLGDYIFWDDERQTEFIRNVYGWKETEIEGTYKRYKSAECIMPGMHDFTNFLKRGYGRGSYHASIDVRNGLLTREEGFELANKYDSIRPEALDYFLKISGMTEKEFYQTMQKHKMAKIKKLKLNINPKKRKNQEKIKPFVEQLIEENQREKSTLLGSIKSEINNNLRKKNE